MEEDFLAMICADALAVSQSTLAPLVSHHSFASRIYFPAACHENPRRDYPVACNEKLIRESARAGTQVRLHLARYFEAVGWGDFSVPLWVGSFPRTAGPQPLSPGCGATSDRRAID